MLTSKLPLKVYRYQKLRKAVYKVCIHVHSVDSELFGRYTEQK